MELISNNYYAMYYSTYIYIYQCIRFRHKQWENTCGFGKSFWKNGFLGGHCANFTELCCTSTNKGIRYLTAKGMLNDIPGGNCKINTSPNTLPFSIPQQLKNVPIERWDKEDRQCLNM